MSGLLTKELIEEAIEIALPTIRLVVKAATWGPLGLVIGVESDDLEDQVIHRMEELGPKETWPEQYHQDFEEIVQQKLATARLGFDSHIVVSEEPWLIQEGCSFYQGAAVSPSGKLRAAASGAYGTTDYRCAKIILEVIGALCSIKIVKLEKANKHVL
jgi:hypothetical protein